MVVAVVEREGSSSDGDSSIYRSSHRRRCGGRRGGLLLLESCRLSVIFFDLLAYPIRHGTSQEAEKEGEASEKRQGMGINK